MVFSCGFFISKCTVQFQWLHFSRFVLSTGNLYYYFQNSFSCIFITFSSLSLYESFGPKNFLIKPSRVLSRKSALFLYNRNIPTCWIEFTGNSFLLNLINIWNGELTEKLHQWLRSIKSNVNSSSILNVPSLP